MWFKILVRKTKNNLFLICYDSSGRALTNVSGGMTGAKGSARLSPASAFSAGKLLVEKLMVNDAFKKILAIESDPFLYQMAVLKKNLRYGTRRRNSERVLEKGALFKRIIFASAFVKSWFFLREFFFLEGSVSRYNFRRFVFVRKLGKFYNSFFKEGSPKPLAAVNEGSFYIPGSLETLNLSSNLKKKDSFLKRSLFMLKKLLKVRSLGSYPFRKKLRDSSLGFWNELKERREVRLQKKRSRWRLKRRRRRRRRRRRSKFFKRSRSLLFLKRGFSSRVGGHLLNDVLFNRKRSVQLFPFLKMLKLRRYKALLQKKNLVHVEDFTYGNFARVFPLLGLSKSLFLRPVAFYGAGLVKSYKKASRFAREKMYLGVKQRGFRFVKRKFFYRVNPPFWRRRFGIKFLLFRKKLPVFHFHQVRAGIQPFVFLVASTKMDQNVRAAMRGVITHFPRVIRIFGFFRVPHNGVRAKKQRRL